MALKPVIQTTEGVDEALASLYTEQDGVFVLDLDHEALDKHPHVRGLVTANKANADKAKERQAKIEELQAQVSALPDDFDAEKWAKLKDGKPDEAALVKLRQELEKERDDWKGKFEQMSETARKNALDRDLTDALTEAGVTNPTFAKAARTMLSDGVKIGDDGKPFVETDMGPLALGEHVKRWAAGEGKDFVTAPKGGGGKGGDGGGTKPLAEMGDAERMELAKAGKLRTT
jgi:hypothetical protein